MSLGSASSSMSVFGSGAFGGATSLAGGATGVVSTAKV